MENSTLDLNWGALNLKTLKKGVFTFLLISFSTLLILFLYNHSEESYSVIQKLQPPFIALALITSVFDMMLGGWRNHFVLKYFHMRISPWVCFKANLANVFMSAVTPTQSGGGPALYYFLYRNGVKLADAVVMTFINWISTILFFLVSASLSLYVLNDQVPDGMLAIIVKYSFVIFGAILSAIVVLMIRPRSIEKIIFLLFHGSIAIFRNKASSLRDWRKKTISNIRIYREGVVSTFAKNPSIFLYSIGITILLYSVKYLLAYFLLLGIGAYVPFWLFMCIQATIQFVLYFAPSQGGSGIAELSIAGLLSGYLANESLPIFTLAHRTFLLFLPALIGAIFTIRQLKRDALNE